MNLIIDSITDSLRPELVELWRDLAPAAGVEVIDSFLSPAQFAHRLSQLKPDVLVVAPTWLPLSAMLLKVLELCGYLSIPRIIATNASTDILKIQATHHGYSDVLDLSMSSQMTFDQINGNCQGISALDHDEVWERVPRPLLTPDLTNVPRDTTDVNILDLITVGLRDQDMASALHLSIQTIKNRISRMLELSGAENRTQLGYLYVNQNLVSIVLMNIENEYKSIVR